MKYVRLNIKFIKHRLIDLDLNREQLSQKIGGTKAQVGNWFFTNGENIPCGKVLGSLLEVLECEISDLLCVVEEPSNE